MVRTVRRWPSLRAGLATLLLLPTACIYYADVTTDTDRHPVVNTGASATILYPGQRPPPLPTPPATGTTTSGGAASGGRTSGGSSSSGTQAGGPPATHPGGNAPAAVQTPIQTAPPASEPVLIGGSEKDETRHDRVHEEPLWNNPFWAPVAIFLYPYRKVRDLLRGDPDEAPPASAGSVPPSAPVARQDVQAAYERAQLEELERQLAARESGSPHDPDTRPAPSARAPQGEPLSIAAELAALQRRANPDSQPGVHVPSAPRPQQAAHPGRADTHPGPPADLVEDRNGDGRPDHWSYRAAGLLTRELFDDNGDGVPDRTVAYEPQTGQRSRVEEDSNRDGRIDSWSYYANGVLARRRADLDGDGAIDAWSFYRDEHVVRHEADTNGDGFRDLIDFYEGGKLMRREEDRDGNGRTDRITRFDRSGAPAEQEDDTDGDGRVDVRSHYSEGRLVRRELLTELAARQAGEPQAGSDLSAAGSEATPRSDAGTLPSAP